MSQVILLLALSGQGPEGAYAFKTDTSRPYQPFETLQPESLNVKLLGYVEDTTISILDIAASEDGDYIYAACGGDGLVIYDLRDPSNPVEIRRLSVYRSLGYVEVSGHYLYLSGRYETLKGYFCVYEISDPANPVYLASSDTIGESSYLTIEGSIAYAASVMVYSINISNPSNPVILDSLPCYSTMHSYCDSTLYLLLPRYGDPSDTTWVYILDVSDPANITEINRIWLPGGQMSCVAAWKDTFDLFSPTYGHTFLYVLGGIWADYIWDVTDPLNPELVWEGRTFGTEGIHLHSKFTYQSDILWVYDRELEPDGYYYVGYYKGLRACGGQPIWKAGLVSSGYDYPYYPGRLAIFQFSGDTLVPDTSDTSNPYLDWVRTIYDYPGLQFSLSKEAHVSFSLYTALGARAYQQDLGLLEPGPYIVAIPDLRSGVYVLFMKTNEESFSTNIVFTGGGF